MFVLGTNYIASAFINPQLYKLLMPKQKPYGKRYDLWYSEELFSLFRLVLQEKRTVAELKQITKKKKSTISEQMGFLVSHKIIDVKKNGKEYSYFPNLDVLSDLSNEFLKIKGIPKVPVSLEAKAIIFTKDDLNFKKRHALLVTALAGAKNFSEFILLVQLLATQANA
jgi:hypothetical protein